VCDDEFLALLSEGDRHAWLALSPEDQAVAREQFTQHIPPTQELCELTSKLFARARVGDGRYLQRQKFEGGRIHKCFDNVEVWVRSHPGHLMVSGFLYVHFDYAFQHVRFTPHVVAQNDEGVWLDVTPHNAEGDYLFIQHAGTDAEFAAAFDHGPMDFVYR
jgi:hypothetical protein